MRRFKKFLRMSDEEPEPSFMTLSPIYFAPVYSWARWPRGSNPTLVMRLIAFVFGSLSDRPHRCRYPHCSFR